MVGDMLSSFPVATVLAKGLEYGLVCSQMACGWSCFTSDRKPEPSARVGDLERKDSIEVRRSCIRAEGGMLGNGEIGNVAERHSILDESVFFSGWIWSVCSSPGDKIFISEKVLRDAGGWGVVSARTLHRTF